MHKKEAWLVIKEDIQVKVTFQTVMAKEACLLQRTDEGIHFRQWITGIWRKFRNKAEFQYRQRELQKSMIVILLVSILR
ncbi:MAG: hypothetical protein EZS28_017764 [Streblomastix strix]|uniref:Uncharacterized protein n=1 Tax=Streblomastix strix TaxID=222440 RepID=A0A5J4VW76_9EUKA|nr:MAG: hypothetical protein EZS28_017764 [Streblomastix strix]